MLQNNNSYKILLQFLRSPTSRMSLREISRKSKIALPSTQKYLKQLERESFIQKDIGRLGYQAKRDNPKFCNFKKWALVMELTTNGCIDKIMEKTNPDAIILFGSASDGEDIESSDIDIAILSTESLINVSKYEKQLQRKISLHFFPKFNSLKPELKNNILNGVILYGYVKVF